MTADGTAPFFAERIIQELRAERARMDVTGEWSARLTIDEIDVLLAAVDERNALRKAACAEVDDEPERAKEAADVETELARGDDECGCGGNPAANHRWGCPMRRPVAIINGKPLYPGETVSIPFGLENVTPIRPSGISMTLPATVPDGWRYGSTRAIGSTTAIADRPLSKCATCRAPMLMMKGWTDAPELASWTHVDPPVTAHYPTWRA